MKKKNKRMILAAGAVLAVAVALYFVIPGGFSPYKGQEGRMIKSLSERDIMSLENGTGVAFGGMAKLAELNGYPGPSHVLQMAEKLRLTGEQKSAMTELFNAMKENALKVGAEIMRIEKGLDDTFFDNKISEATLSQMLNASAEKYSELRYVHLSAHLKTVEILTDEQIDTYNKLRGYKIPARTGN